MEKSVNKIPYDDVPISRSRNVGQTRRAWPTSPREQKYAQPSRGTTKVTSAKNTSSVQIQKKHVFGILFALLLVLNIVLCTLLVQAVAQNKFAQQIQQDNIIQVYPDGTENASAVTAKTLFSVVAISAGEDAHGNTGATYAHFFSTQGGSGVIIEHQKDLGNAYILTNYHVVANDSLTNYHESIYVLLYGSMAPIPATVVGGSKYEDLAVLRIQSSQEYKESNAVPVTKADSASVAPGDACLVVGNAEKKGITPAYGIITNTYESYLDTQTSQTMYLLRTDAAINEGNSGGGMFDANGNWIGIVKAKVKSSSVDNFGYAIPSNRAWAITQNIISNNGKLYSSIIGVTLTHADSEAYINPQTGKLYVYYSVQVQTANVTAQNYGFQNEDIITSVEIDGITYNIHHIADWQAVLYLTQSGSVMKVNVQRLTNGKWQTTQFVFSIELHQGVS